MGFGWDEEYDRTEEQSRKFNEEKAKRLKNERWP